MGLRNSNKKAKTKWILEVVVKCCHRKNDLFLPNLRSGYFFFVAVVFFWGGGGKRKKKECRIYLIHDWSATPELRCLSTFVLLCQILLEIQAVCHKGRFFRNVFIFFPGKQWILSWYGSHLQKHPWFLKSKLALLLLRILPCYCSLIP